MRKKRNGLQKVKFLSQLNLSVTKPKVKFFLNGIEITENEHISIAKQIQFAIKNEPDEKDLRN